MSRLCFAAVLLALGPASASERGGVVLLDEVVAVVETRVVLRSDLEIEARLVRAREAAEGLAGWWPVH